MDCLGAAGNILNEVVKEMFTVLIPELVHLEHMRHSIVRGHFICQQDDLITQAQRRLFQQYGDDQ
jgi:hypothetical protein